MRQIILLIICTMAVFSSFAELRLKMVETNDSTTVITLKEECMRKKAPAKQAKLYNDGATYKAINIKNGYENCCNIYQLVFPRQAVLNNTKVELKIRKKTVTEDIWKQIYSAALQSSCIINGSKVIIKVQE